MGVGVYSNSFNGFGETFSVETLFFQEEDYLEYLDNLASSNEIIVTEKDDEFYVSESGVENPKRFHSKMDALEESLEKSEIYVPGFDEWASEQRDDEYNEIKESIVSAVSRLGFWIQGNDRSLKGMDLDRNISVLAESDHFQIGLMSWESDYVVAIAPTTSFDDTLNNKMSILDTYLRPVEAFSTDIESVIGKLTKQLRRALLEAGYKAYYKTSGYTSKAYDDIGEEKEPPPFGIDFHEARLIERLGALFKPGYENLDLLKIERYAVASDIAEVLSNEERYGVPECSIRIPFFNKESECIHLYDVGTKEFVSTKRIEKSFEIETPFLQITDEDGDIFTYAPVNDPTVIDILIESQAKKPDDVRFPTIFVTSEEWMNITKDDIYIKDDEGKLEVLFSKEPLVKNRKP